MKKPAEKEFVPFKIAKAMRDIGFDEPCFAGFCEDGEFAPPDDELNCFRNRNRSGGEISAPTWRQAFAFFREKHNLDSDITKMWRYGYNSLEKNRETFYRWCICDFTLERKKESVDISMDSPYQKHEKAELSCLVRLIELVKEKLDKEHSLKN